MKFNHMKFSNHSNLYFNLSLSVGFAFLLLLFRMKITHSSFYLFLVWNLFLAGIPFAITQLFKMSSKLRSLKIVGFLGFAAWLLFLPNSPYIITDLVHLHSDRSSLVWLDLFLVFVFAFNGLLLGLLSMLDMFTLISQRYGNQVAKYTLFKVCLLSGYGIYLGRFLRFNSWDITTKPATLFYQIAYSLKEPKVWLITFAFGGFLWILFSVLQSVLSLRESQMVEKRG
ncbi:DUF1361 domain-containing protein [Maribacter algarum]|uniref:DUF1361 domain-containing protein n=2 Tax=Maribacter algarum (ex Zhang et al. 2020) TaxID=2578118 RepID=A0A5S3PSN6_9FLAO|nr:DUF1361 domain-containing protein [Maribacter algarum]